jgi:hypothetical protein
MSEQVPETANDDEAARVVGYPPALDAIGEADIDAGDEIEDVDEYGEPQQWLT